MKTTPKFKSDAFAAIHASANALFEVGAINKTTLRNFDKSCLVMPLDIDPRKIRNIREKNNLSQPVFARYLNISESTIQKWESGDKKPSGIALKLLSILEKRGLEVLE
jgi:putative transcriptional regulator